MFIKNIKQRYFQNLLDSYIKNNDTDSIKKILKSQFIANKNLNFDDFMNYINLFASQQKFENLFTKNLIWINSFDKDDYSYVNNFLNDFLKSQSIQFNKTEEYFQKLNEIRKTYSLKKEDVSRKWFVIDVSDKILGRVATKIADRIRGKDKPTAFFCLMTS